MTLLGIEFEGLSKAATSGDGTERFEYQKKSRYRATGRRGSKVTEIALNNPCMRVVCGARNLRNCSVSFGLNFVGGFAPTDSISNKIIIKTLDFSSGLVGFMLC